MFNRLTMFANQATQDACLFSFVSRPIVSLLLAARFSEGVTNFNEQKELQNYVNLINLATITVFLGSLAYRWLNQNQGHNDQDQENNAHLHRRFG